MDEQPVAFGQLNPIDHVAYLYCAFAHARRGYASTILDRLVQHAQAGGVHKLRVESSCVARPFFEHKGFCVVEEEYPVRHGVKFLRFKMEKELAKK